MLALWGGTLLARHRKRAAIVALAAPFIALANPSSNLPPGFKILARSHSLYGLVEVIEDQNRGVRALRADHSITGAHYITDRSSAFAFPHVLEWVRFLRPHGTNLLQIGLGIGSLPMALLPHGITSDVVEIDPIVVRYAQTYFGFTTAGIVSATDGRTFLNGAPHNHYDIVVHDTFTGGSTPEHLLSLEVLQTIHGVLRPGGVLALDFLGYQRGARAEASWAIMRTLRSVFKIVRAYRDMSPDATPDSISNIVFFASDGPLDAQIPGDARFENDVCADTLRSLQSWEILRDIPSGLIITDSRNPLSRLQVAVASEHFDFMRHLMPKEIWIQ